MKPNLYIMIGLPGSGKDTIAKQIQAVDRLKNVILSSDNIRIELFGWEDQSKNGRVFLEMNKRCKEYLSKGFNVIYNATNLSKKRRMALINEMNKYANIDAILCLCPIGTIFERNFIRFERHIPEDKLFQMFRTMDIPMKYEGYNNIYYINTDKRYNSREMIDWFLEIGKDYDQQNEHHNATVQDHLLLTAQMAFQYSQDENLYEAGRFHDIGKPYSREWNEDKQKYTYYEHHRMSAYLYLLYSTYDFDIYIYNKETHLYRGIEDKNMVNLKKFSDNVLEIATLIYHHMDKFIGNLEKTKELLGDELYSKLEILMKADAYRE